MKKIGKYVFSCGIAGMLCVLALFSCLPGRTVHAAESAAVVSSRTTDTEIYIYVKSAARIVSGTTIQIGNTLCGDLKIADVTAMGLPIRTTLLFDNSLSLSQSWGEQSKELLRELIDGHAEGEEIKLATFADSLSVVSDYSTDYEALKSAVEGIEFLNQDSYLTDILYDMLQQDRDDGTANYTRYIIITDGADDQDIKYTQAELSELMKQSGVVIHAVGVKAAKNNAALESLFSYARLTGGSCTTVEKKTAATQAKDAINEDYQISCLKLKPEAEIADGGRKEAKLDLKMESGEATLRVSLLMPFADVNAAAPESAVPEVSSAPESSSEKQELPSIDLHKNEAEKPQKSEKSGEIPFVIFAAAGGAAVLVIAVIVVLIIAGKKKKQQANALPAGDVKPGASAQPDVSTQPGVSVQPGGNTAMLGRQAAGSSNRTMRLQGGGQEARQAYISLTDIQNPQRSFRAPIDMRIVIGRESGDIMLGDDGAVSYTHCEIIRKGSLFYVNDLKSSNGTFYGNARVYQETPIMSGGVLEMGNYKYKITIEN